MQGGITDNEFPPFSSSLQAPWSTLIFYSSGPKNQNLTKVYSRIRQFRCKTIYTG